MKAREMAGRMRLATEDIVLRAKFTFFGPQTEVLIAAIRTAPSRAMMWVRLIDSQRRLGGLSEDDAALAVAHDIMPGRHFATVFADEVSRLAGAALSDLARDPLANISAALRIIVQWRTTVHCRIAFEGADGYHADAVRDIDEQWRKVIWPIIEGSDFSAVLELACGYGRNTARLLPLVQSIDLVDVNLSCIDACRARFADSEKTIRYHVTDGNHFRDVPNASITFGYSWDSMVHFDKQVVRDYLFEFARVLKPGGMAFLHASNYGAFEPNSSWITNHGSRSDLSRDLFNQYAAEAGLAIRYQRLSGRADGWGMDDLDCISVVGKPY